MRFYFLSKEECAVKIDGEYAGILGGNLVYIDHCGHNMLLEFFPSDRNYSPAAAFFKTPKKGVRVGVAAIPSADGFLIFPLFKTAKSKSVCNVFQKTYAEKSVGVSITADPYLKIIVANADDYFITEPKYYSDDARIDCKLVADFVFLTIKSKHEYLYVFSVKGKIALRYSEEIENVCFSDTAVIASF